MFYAGLEPLSSGYSPPNVIEWITTEILLGQETQPPSQINMIRVNSEEIVQKVVPKRSMPVVTTGPPQNKGPVLMTGMYDLATSFTTGDLPSLTKKNTAEYAVSQAYMQLRTPYLNWQPTGDFSTAATHPYYSEILLDVNCMIDDKTWIRLRLVVDTGAMDNTIYLSRLPEDYGDRLTPPIKLIGVGGSVICDRTAQFNIQFPARRGDNKFIVETPTRFLLTPSNLNGCDGLISMGWLAERGILVDTAHSKLIVPHYWKEKTPQLFRFSQEAKSADEGFEIYAAEIFENVRVASSTTFRVAEIEAQEEYKMEKEMYSLDPYTFPIRNNPPPVFYGGWDPF